MPASRASSATAWPRRCSAATPSRVIWCPLIMVSTRKTPWQDRSAARIDARSSRSPVTRLAPASRSCLAAGMPGSRTSARTAQPRLSRARAAAPPCWPVAPITSTGPSPLAMVARLAVMLVVILVLILPGTAGQRPAR